MATVIGIDLGTTNCAVSYLNSNGIAEILQNNNGANTTPSVVLFDDDERIVGIEAKNSMVIDAESTVSFAKRYMDRPAELGFSYNGVNYSAIDISAIILKKLKQDAEAKLNDIVEEAVITVPAYFDNNAKEATKQAAEIAGLKVLRLIMEPSAAALYYSFMNDNKLNGKRILVYDLGGGTFDVSVVDLNGGEIDVIATEGDPKLGGKDFDERLISYFKEKIEEKFPSTIDWNNKKIEQELYEKAELHKKTLSSKTSVKRLTFNFAPEFKEELTREKFQELTSNLTFSTINILKNVIKEAKEKDGKDIDEIILVGGSTKAPFISEEIEKEFGIKPLSNVNPDEVVAQGAALLATKIDIEEKGNSSKSAQNLPENIQNNLKMMKIYDIVPYSLGFTYFNGSKTVNKVIIPHGTKIPHKTAPILGYSIPANSTHIVYEMTQGDGEDVDLVEIIGTSVVNRPSNIPLGQSVPLVEIYSYNEDGLIRVEGKCGDESFSLEVKSEHILDKNELKQKQDELSAKEVE